MSVDSSNSNSPPNELVEGVPFGSNTIRLTIREWGIVLAIVLLVVTVLPSVWKAWERFEPGPDYRVPHALSNDYWVYERLVKHASDGNRILFIGDSVIWGEYVAPDQALAHALNEQFGSERFVNGGLNGSHPLALEGLVRYYTQRITNRRVILHCNLLWMSSPERDLQTKKAVSFNHPQLLPQLMRKIPAYKASASDRLGTVFDRAVPFRVWVHHLRVVDFEGLDLHTWSLEHPYENPLGRIEREIPAPSTELRHRPISWTERGIEQQDLPWIDLDTSLQWQAFRKTVHVLRKRKNQVFVIVGPFNEHLLVDDSREKYGALRQLVEQWLSREDIPCYVPPVLPSSEYGDLSHPLSAGYVRLAESILANPTFQQWSGDR